ncbi:MAG: SMP-30/gluconolactonase/LRE family protein, partial [Phycisphaerales bacterium]|nr:SMP-30/gluconolactonase/LRE family protein [Phycisphaerales bacterium]
MLLLSASAPAAPRSERIYVVDAARKQVQQYRKSGTGRTTVLATEYVVGPGLAYDADDQQLFWTDDELGQVVRLDTTTNELTRLACHGFYEPTGIDVDPVDNIVYAIDRAAPSITRFSYDGALMEDIVVTSLSAPLDIGVHHGRQMIYWTEPGIGVFSATTTGENIAELELADIIDPQRIVINEADDLMYISEIRRIWRVDLNTGTTELVMSLTPTQSIVGGIALDATGERLYWNLSPSPGGTALMSYNLVTSSLIHIATGSSNADIVADPNTGTIFWSDGIRIRMTSDGITEDYFVSTVVLPSAIAIDPVDQNVYWSDGATIRRSGLDGSDHVAWLELDLAPRAMTVDLDSRRLAWIEGASTIRYRPLAGGAIMTVPTSGLISLNDLAIANGSVFVVDSALDAVIRITLRTGEKTTLYEFNDLAAPNALEIDRAHNLLYWADPVRDEIWRITLDGFSPELVLTDHAGPHDVAIDASGETLYWTTFTPPEIRRITLDGSAFETFPLPASVLPQFVALGPMPDGFLPSDVTGNGVINID